MKKVLTIIGIVCTLVANAQTLTPSQNTLCAGEQVQLVVSGIQGYGQDTLNYSWYQNGAPMVGTFNNDTITVTPTTGTVNYNVVAYANGNTVAFATTSIVVNSLPVVTLAPYGPLCTNSPVFNLANTLTESPTGGTFKVNGVVATTVNPSQLGAGVHVVRYIYTNSNGCTDSTSISITINTIPTATITPNPNDSVCVGSGVSLIATGGTTYSWSNGSTNQVTSFVVNTSTNLVVTVTDANGCSNTANQTITALQPPIIQTNVINNVACFGGNNGSAWVSANGMAPFTYLWSNGITNDTVSGLITGSYTVTVSDAFNCTATAPATITQPNTALTVTLDSMKQVTCNGGSNGKLYVSVNGGTGTYSYNWSNGSNSQDLINVTAGNYGLTVTDANGCTVNSSVYTVGQPSTPLTVVANGNNINCNGSNNGTALAIAAGGTAPYTYGWSNGATTSLLSNLTPGTYIANATDANGCNTADTITITQPSPMTVTLDSIKQVSCNGLNNGKVYVSVNGGTGTYSYSWSNGSNSQDLINVTAGNYSLTVTDANGCTVTANFSITQPTALSATTSTQAAGCTIAGLAVVSTTGGVQPYTYLWNNGMTNDSIMAINGFYTVTVTDANNCVTTANATITPPTQPSATAVVSHVNCYGGTDGAVNITVAGDGQPFAYSWDNGATSQDLANVPADTFTVTMTANNGCVGTATYIVQQPTAPLAATISKTDVSCHNESDGSASIQITGGTPGYSYNWSNGASTAVITNLSAGTISVVVTDANNCTVNGSTTILQPTQALSVAPTNIDYACFGSNNGGAIVSATGGTGTHSYSWNNGQNGPNLTNVTTGTYSVTVTDANGCSAGTNVTVPGQLSPIAITLTTDITPCGNSASGQITAAAIGGNGGYTYTWNNGQSGPIASNLQSGSYNVTVTDGIGCTHTQNTFLGSSSNLTVSLSSGPAITLCSGNTQMISPTVNGGTFPYTYQWTLANGQLGINPNINPQQTGLYTLNVTDNYGCTGTASTYVTVSTQQEPNASFAFVNSSAYMVEFVSNSSNATALSWSINGLYVSNSGVLTYTFPGAGTYTVQLVASNDCDSDTAYQTVNIGTTGVDDQQTANWVLYPNPVQQNNPVVITGEKIQGSVLTVYNMVGQIMYQTRIVDKTTTLPSNWASGTYVLHVQKDGELMGKQRLIIQ